MFKTIRPFVAVAALLASTSTAAFAADPYVPPPVEPPPPVVYEEEKSHDYSGWYIRGDVDYHWSDLRSVSYTTYGGGVPTSGNLFSRKELDGAWSIGAGVGYQIRSYLRTDLTIDYWSKADFVGSTPGACGNPFCSTDTSSYKAWLVMANAYIDLGTYHGITPYVGAGIGGAYVEWDNLRNTVPAGTFIHNGAATWRFAYALMAGASYCLTNKLEVDLGYRYTRIEGGPMFAFEAASVTGPGRDHGFKVHEGRAGLRWHLGNRGNRCSPPPPKLVDYIPPVYK